MFKHDRETKLSFFRVMIRRMIANEPRNSDRKGLLREILGSSDLQQLAVAYADYASGHEVSAAEEGDGRFFEFFQWLIENQDAVIAFIEKIIALFAGMQSVSKPT